MKNLLFFVLLGLLAACLLVSARPRGRGPARQERAFRLCEEAREACRVETTDGRVLKNTPCPINSTCSDGPERETLDGTTYSFWECTETSGVEEEERCLPMKNGRRGPSGGNGNGPETPDIPEPQVQLPPERDSDAETLLCQNQRWFDEACRIVNSTEAELKNVACSREGTCTAGPGAYTMANGEEVLAYFCENCLPGSRSSESMESSESISDSSEEGQGGEGNAMRGRSRFNRQRNSPVPQSSESNSSEEGQGGEGNAVPLRRWRFWRRA